jgi:hypothetical protein
MKARIHKKQIKELKEIMGCLGLERSGKQSELADRLFNFLKKPAAADCTAHAPRGLAKKVWVWAVGVCELSGSGELRRGGVTVG